MVDKKRVAQASSAVSTLFLGVLSAGQVHGQSTAAPSLNSPSATEEIIVTAQRREERLVDVPATVSVRTAADLQQAGIGTINQLTEASPGVQFAQNGAQTLPTIRGITAQVINAGNDANVALYVDGIYQPNQSVTNFSVADIERVEILKGPQGTLFGRNATGGAIQIITRDPSFTRSAYASASYGSYNQVKLSAYGTGPLVEDRLAFHVSISHDEHTGYNKDLRYGGYSGDVYAWSARGKLRYQPSDSVDIVLSGWHGRRQDGSGVVGNALNGNSQGNAAGFPTPSEPWVVASDVVHNTTAIMDEGALKARFDLGFAELSSNTAFLRFVARARQSLDYSGGPGSVFDPSYKPSHTFSQEFQLTSTNEGRLKWIAGAFYYHDNARQFTYLNSPGALQRNSFTAQNTRSYAFFGEATYDITARLHLTGGIRYNLDHKYLYADIGPLIPLPANLTPRQDKAWPSWTPKVSLRYDLTDRSSVYFTFNEGFKSGAYQASAFTLPPVTPEKVTAFEAGFKGKVFDQLDVNLAAFHYDYTNLQTTAFINNLPTATVTNSGTASIKGLDVESTLRASQDLTFRAGLSVLDAHYKSFPGAQFLTPRFLNGRPNGNATVSGNATGHKLIKSPSWTLNLNANYEHEFNWGTFAVNGTMFHSDKFFFDADNRVTQPAYTSFAGQISYVPPDSNFKFSVWGTNLSNVAVIGGTLINGQADGVSWAAPRMVGMRVEYKY